MCRCQRFFVCGPCLERNTTIRHWEHDRRALPSALDAEILELLLGAPS